MDGEGRKEDLSGKASAAHHACVREFIPMHEASTHCCRTGAAPMDTPQLPSHHRLCEAWSQEPGILVCPPRQVHLHGTTAGRSHSQRVWCWCALWHPGTTPKCYLTSGHRRWCSSYAGRQGLLQSGTLFCVSACVPAAQRKTLAQRNSLSSVLVISTTAFFTPSFLF